MNVSADYGVLWQVTANSAYRSSTTSGFSPTGIQFSFRSGSGRQLHVSCARGASGSSRDQCELLPRSKDTDQYLDWSLAGIPKSKYFARLSLSLASPGPFHDCGDRCAAKWDCLHAEHSREWRNSRVCPASDAALEGEWKRRGLLLRTEPTRRSVRVRCSIIRSARVISQRIGRRSRARSTILSGATMCSM